MAIFRDGIVPDYKDLSLLNPKGGYFSLTVLTNVGMRHREKMNQLGQLFRSLLSYFFGINNRNGLEAGPQARAAVCGIFAQAEANDDDTSKELPVKFRFQVWLRDWHSKKNIVADDLKEWTAAKPNGFGFRQLKFVKKSDRKVRV